MKSASAKPYGSSAHLAYQLVSGGLGGLREVEIDSPVDVIVLLQSSSVKTSWSWGHFAKNSQFLKQLPSLGRGYVDYGCVADIMTLLL